VRQIRIATIAFIVTFLLALLVSSIFGDHVYGQSIGNGVTVSITASYNGLGANNLHDISMVVYKDGVRFERIALSTLPTTVQWGANVPNENATYTFYIEALSGNTGEIESGNLRTITVTASN
jgi:hypothetical protein